MWLILFSHQYASLQHRSTYISNGTLNHCFDSFIKLEMKWCKKTCKNESLDFYTFCLPEILVAHIAEIRQSFKMILNMPPYTARTAFII